jgi:hypothetical protein
MTKWQYRVETTTVGGFKERNMDEMTAGWLNKIGAEGWELVNTTIPNVGNGLSNQRAYLVFKRPLG